MNAKYQVLLILGVLVLVKGLLGLAFPAAMRRAAVWWLGVARRAHFAVAAGCFLLGLLMWAVILMHEPLSHWILGIGAILAGCAGMLYLRPGEFERVTQVLLLKRGRAWIRVLGAAGVALAAWLLWVVLTGR
jgi:hypothetical protein